MLSFADCSGKKPLEGPLKEELEEALVMAERFTQQYNALLRRFEEQMFNTSSVLDLFNRQFGWVSSLANSTSSKDGIFRLQTVRGAASLNCTEKSFQDELKLSHIVSTPYVCL